MSRFAVLCLLLFGSGIASAAQYDTATTVSCTPDPATLHASTTCTALVENLENNREPIGDILFSSDSTGSFSPVSCTVSDGPGNGNASCSVTYTVNAFDSGTHTITADYQGGTQGFREWLPSSGNLLLDIQYPAPTITAITPAIGNRGGSVNVTVDGSGFVAGATTLDLGANIAVSGITVLGPTQLTATLTIDVAAVTGLRDVVVTNPAPGGGSATLLNAFNVQNPLPVTSSLSPGAAEVGTGALTLTVFGSGFVDVSVAYFNGTARSTAFVNSGELQMDLLAADTATLGDYPVHVVNPAPGGGASNTVQFSVVPSGGSFDAVEESSGIGTPLNTRLAGTLFSVDLLAADVGRTAIDTTFTGTVKVELLDATDDTGAFDGASGCRASWTVAQTLPDAVFNAGDNGRVTISTTFANALRVARFRVSYPSTGTPTHIGCSTDAFSIRPTALTLGFTLNNGGTSGLPVQAAGTNFALGATAIAGYDGTPQINSALLDAHTGTPSTGALAGSFSAADPLSGESTGTFAYTEVGHFTLAASGLYDDTFTAIDQPGGCTANFSNTLTGDLYGCSFGNTAPAGPVGRFTPAYFDVVVTDACTDSTGFTYSGQPFTATITAREAGGGITAYYAGGYAKAVTLSDAGDATNFEPGTNVIAASLFAGGIASNPVTEYRFATPETGYSDIAVRAIDADNVSSAGHLEETTEIRRGRFVIAPTETVTIFDADMTISNQTWQEVSPGVFDWDVHADDTTCTVPVAGDFTLGNYTGNLQTGETGIINFTFAAGTGTITFSSPGNGNDGGADVTGAVADWLEFDWNGTGTEAPAGKLRFFEIFFTEDGFIDRHEVVN